MAATAALLQHHTVLYSRDCSLLYTHTLILIRHYMTVHKQTIRVQSTNTLLLLLYSLLGILNLHLHLHTSKSKHFNTRSNHYFGKSFYTLPNKSTVQAPVHLGVFSHDVTRMVYSPRPSSSKYIYTFHGGCVGEGGWDVKERAKEERPIAETTIFSTFLFLHYRTGPPISQKQITSCVHRIVHSFYTWPKTIPTTAMYPIQY